MKTVKNGVARLTANCQLARKRIRRTKFLLPSGLRRSWIRLTGSGPRGGITGSGMRATIAALIMPVMHPTM
jgi:hypothetical protein